MINFQPKGKVVQEIENMHEEQNGCVHGFNSITFIVFLVQKSWPENGAVLGNIEMGEGVWRST